MTTPIKKRLLTEEELRECAALNAIYKSRKKELRLTQEQIAIEGLKASSQSAASHYLTGRNALNAEAAAVFSRYLQVPVEKFSPRLAREIAALANSVSPEGSNLASASQPHREEKEYPLISWVAAGLWAEACDHLSPGDAEGWLKSHENAGPRGYWLEVKGHSMVDPQGEGFQPGTLILVRPEDFDLVSGKLYIAKLIGSGETTFKQYIRDAGVGYLRPLNPSFRTIQITEDVEIIGRVIDAKLPRSLF